MKIPYKMIGEAIKTLLQVQGRSYERVFTEKEFNIILYSLERYYKEMYNQKYFKGVGFKILKGGVPNSYRHKAYGTYIDIKLIKGQKPSIRIDRVGANYVSKEWQKGYYVIYE